MLAAPKNQWVVYTTNASRETLAHGAGGQWEEKICPALIEFTKHFRKLQYFANTLGGMNRPWAAVVRKKDQENKAMTCKRSQNPCGISGVEVSPLAFRAMDNLLGSLPNRQLRN